MSCVTNPPEETESGLNGQAIRFPLIWALFFVTLLVGYWQTLPYGPVVDDPAQMEWVLGFEGVSDVMGIDAGGLFRPVKNLAFYIFARDGSLLDLRVAALAIFALYGVAFYLFARRFIRPRWALVASFFVLLHPAQVASVAFPSAINNLFSATCILLFCHLAAGYLENPSRSQWTLPLLALTGMLALFGYELGVVIVPLSVLLVFYYRRSAGIRPCLYLLGLASILVFFYLFIRSGQNAIGQQTHPMIPPAASSLDLFFSAPFYTLKHFWMAVWPVGQGGMLLVDDPRGSVFRELPYWLLLGLSSLVLIWRIERRRSLWAFGLLFFILAMTPLSNWIPLRNGPIANYYLLLPLCGLALVFGWILQSCAECGRLKVCRLLSLVVLIGFLLGSIYRASWWGSQHSIYEFNVRNHPQSWLAWDNWGVALTARGENSRALEAFERSAALADWFLDPLENRVWLLLLMGESATVVDLVESREDVDSSGWAAAATLAYSLEGRSEQARAWAGKVDRGALKPGQLKWFSRVADGL